MGRPDGGVTSAELHRVPATMTVTSHPLSMTWTTQWITQCRMDTLLLGWNLNMTITQKTEGGGYNSASCRHAKGADNKMEFMENRRHKYYFIIAINRFLM